MAMTGIGTTLEAYRPAQKAKQALPDEAKKNLAKLYDQGYKIVSCSCACGGSWAWVKKDLGAEIMQGCVCHTNLPVK